MSTNPEFPPTHIVTLNGIDVPVQVYNIALDNEDDPGMILLQAAATAVESFQGADAVVTVVATGETDSFSARDIREWWA